MKKNETVKDMQKKEAQKNLWMQRNWKKFPEAEEAQEQVASRRKGRRRRLCASCCA